MMIGVFFQAPPVKDNGTFQNIEDNINSLALKFWQIYFQCYELNKIMQ
jgi:hypothetical protein